MTYLHIQPEAPVTLLHKLPHGSALRIMMLPELTRHDFEIHCWVCESPSTTLVRLLKLKVRYRVLDVDDAYNRSRILEGRDTLQTNSVLL